MHEILRLDAPGVTVAIEWELGRVPVWRHLGAPLGADTALLHGWRATDTQRLPPGTLDRLDGVPLLPGSGNGHHFAEGVRLHAQGQGAVHEWVAQSYTRVDRAQAQTLTLHLVDAVVHSDALHAEVALTLYRDSGVLAVRTRLHNPSAQAWALEHGPSACLPVAAHFTDVAYCHGQWAHEFQWKRRPLGREGWFANNTRGKTSHEQHPSCALLGAHADDLHGEVLLAHLAWSGNHQLALQRQGDGGHALLGGVHFLPGEQSLPAGHTWESPVLLLAYSSQGWCGASQRLHQHARSQVLRWGGGAMRARPVHLNTWEAVYFDHDQATLRDLADAAAAVGVERFVLDDGWFPGRPNDKSGLGDWWPDPAKYPQGLGPLIDHVRARGMEFGLWVEPEMVSPDSALYRAHPDWALGSAGRALQTGRHQLVLDLGRAEVADYLFDKLDALLRAHPIAYLKWDMNRDYAQAENALGQPVAAAQVLALYALLERLHQAHPGLEIESCASGGGRMDLGVLRHTQRFWTSDNNDAVARVAIQHGAQRLFPLEVLGAHVGPAPAHATGRSQSLAFRCAVALFGHMGVEADVRHLGDAERAELRRWIDLYRHWRGVLHGARQWQGSTDSGVWWLAAQADCALLGVFTTAAPDTPHHAPLRLPDAWGAAHWRVRLIAHAGQERARGDAPAPWWQALAHGGVRLSGSELCAHGLPLPQMNPESALVFSLQREPAPDTPMETPSP